MVISTFNAQRCNYFGINGKSESPQHDGKIYPWFYYTMDIAFLTRGSFASSCSRHVMVIRTFGDFGRNSVTTTVNIRNTITRWTLYPSVAVSPRVQSHLHFFRPVMVIRTFGPFGWNMVTIKSKSETPLHDGHWGSFAPPRMVIRTFGHFCRNIVTIKSTSETP